MNKKDYIETLKLLEKEITKLAALVSFEIEKVNTQPIKAKDSSLSFSPLSEDTSISAFVQSCIDFSPHSYVGKDEIYSAYYKYCMKNAIIFILNRQTFCKEFPIYCLRSKKVYVENNRTTSVLTGKKRFRIFKGVTLKQTETN